ncbi:tRNA-splicing endonuclease subunit Sen54 [Austrofundulus limnaeus]|uniref:tRNA-splicing endonuclease subunit Sen54 n=1 Tax=Austrofundulus limnaeus TaxID=52670 RepID=A0A2I4BD95_AUSLI|nr:PREDICTED: tRNA-splicing endonuclease subunit Sen54 [Austrofundulus limnaeus]
MRRSFAGRCVENMADHNMTETTETFYNEILSPCELFAARSRSHKIPVRGQKDFFPNDSEEQKQRLQQSLDEHWSLISEERVERLGSLVKATWIPSEQIVELQTPAGKFWQTMGFSANGKQYLLPEEALYLMECGNVLVFYKELPLSIQDGYEKFLSSDTLSLQQYQVFGHLKRLGYVVHRFDSSSEPSSYARQLNLPQSRERGGRALKRKRSPSPSQSARFSSSEPSSYARQLNLPQSRERGGRALKRKRSPSPSQSASCTQTRAQSPAEKMEGNKLAEPQLTTSTDPPETRSALSRDEGRLRTWWMTDDPERDPGQRSELSSPRRSRRDFSAVPLPDLGSGHPSHMAPPDPSVLPGALAVGVCDVAAWRHRINLRKVKMSAKEERREERRRRWDVNKDREVRRCRNWAEYHELLARRQARRRGRPHHLWNREVKPLHDPTQPISTAELLEKISVIKPTHLMEGASRLKGSDEWRICFNVYQPDSVSNFKKSSPGQPYTRMCVCSFDGPVPDLRVVKQLSFQSGDVPVVFAVVDHGDISFYTFKDFQLPRDIYP